MKEYLVSLLTTGWSPDARGYLALACVFFVTGMLPIIRTPLVIVSGLVFGLSAVPVIVLSSTAGGMAAFLLGRHLLQTQVRRLLARRRLADAILRAFDLEGWRALALMRFYGPLPTTVQNYAFSITRIPLWRFGLVTLVFSIPQTVFYAYLGSLGQYVLRGEFPGWVSVTTLMCASACASAVILLVGRRVRTLLREADRSAGSRAGAPIPAAR